MLSWRISSDWRRDRVISLLCILGGNTLVMDSSEQITYHLPYLQDQKLERLHWILRWSGIDTDHVVYTGCQSLDYTRCNTQNHWRSADAHFQTGTVSMSLSRLLIMAANPSIMGKCRSTALALYKMQHSKLLTLCWHSVDAVLMLC
jgi:hypothetical protein